MLPIEDALPALKAALETHPACVLVAPPGAGKTTRVPLALMETGWAKRGRILVLSPRRVAARAAAQRMAQALGEPVGAAVGYRVRLEAKVSAQTRVEVVTEGVFTRRILADPTLEGVAAVLFDEFHERSLEGDLGLALARDAQLGLREDLRLLVMSATLAAAPVAGLLGDAPVVQSEGRRFPVAVRYLGRDPRRPIEDQVADAALRALAAEAGSILCFLPGVREINRAEERIRERLEDPAVSVHPLHGALEPRAQDAAIAPPPPGTRKVVLATAIAETSLTIEGVRVVIDCGLSRQARYDPASAMTRLETVRASRASAEQRAGRAGRLAPGACWRLWDEPETRSMPAFDPPEILNADLSGLALDLALWGVADPAALAWLDPPPAGAFGEARGLLRELGALDGDGRLTAHGRAMAGFGLPPRLAHMMLAAGAGGIAREAGLAAAVLTEQGLGGRSADLRERMAQALRDRGPRAAAARQLAQRLARQAGGEASEQGLDLDAAGQALALAFPDRIAMARPGKRGEFLMANGRAGGLAEDEPLAAEAFLAVAEAQGAADRARITLAAPLNAASFERDFAARIITEDELRFDPAARAVRARRVRRLGRITLSATPGERPDPAAAAEVLAAEVRAQGLGLLAWSEAAAALRARALFLQGLGVLDGPDLSDAALLADLDSWFLPAAHGHASLDAVEPRLFDALLGLFDYPARTRLETLAPARFETPAGGSAAIDYASPGGPTVAVRLQELFGMAVHPTVAGGRAPLTLELLSPAQRPVQTTKDLPGFWRGSYADVRKDLKGRYPKHPWPEDPLAAEPTRRAKPRKPSGD